MNIFIESNATIAITGKLGYAERKFGKNTVQAHAISGKPVYLTLNGVEVDFHRAPRGYQKFAMATAKQFNLLFSAGCKG